MRAEIRDIARPLSQAVILSANGLGVMRSSVSLSFKEIAGPEIEIEAKNLCKSLGKPFEPGSCFTTLPYKMIRRGVKRVYHAVIRKYPGGMVSLDAVNKAVREALDMAIKDRCRTIVIPGIGTGSGRLDKGSVARILVPIARNVCDKIEIRFIDKNKEFINEIKRLLGQEF